VWRIQEQNSRRGAAFIDEGRVLTQLDDGVGEGCVVVGDDYHQYRARGMSVT
jgi:hypothetical protein